MELGSMVKDVLQNVAEHAASYSIGQTALRYLDRTLKVIEKCARWAVPPPLDQDERPQPELVRPLPWVFFLCMLIVLRLMRESISLANLIMGKPPLRSADVVIYIQSKRRYLRTLKYQGNRIMRARTGSAQPREPWYSSLRSLFEFTMCFRRNSLTYGNNNTTSVSNNEEVLVVKRNKRGREDASPVTSGSVESPMERLIEKMMVDLNADSDEDSSYTLTDVTSVKSEKLEMQSGSDQATVVNTSLSTIINPVKPGKVNDEIYFAPPENAITSTPVKTESSNQNKVSIEQNDHTEQKKERTDQRIGNIEQEKNKTEQNVHNTEQEKQNTEHRKDKTEEKKENDAQRIGNIEQKKESTEQRKDNIEQKKDYTEQRKDNIEQKKDNTEQKEDNTEQKKDNAEEKIYNTEQKKDDIKQKRENFESKKEQSEPKKQRNEVEKENSNTTKEKLELKKKENEMIVEDKNETAPLDSATMTPEEASLNFIQNERCPQKVQRTPKNEKIANGRTIKSVPSKKKGSQTERREQNATTARLLSENKSF